MAELLATTATLKRGVTAKYLYFCFALLDFLLTLFALRLGLTELNPLVRSLFAIPGYFFLLKVITPLFIAWLIPSRLLLPSLTLLTLVVGWNLKELILFLS